MWPRAVNPQKKQPKAKPIESLPVYHQLKTIVDDYIFTVESICDKRMEIAERDMKYIQKEMSALNCLRNNLRILHQNTYGISEDQFALETSRVVLRGEDEELPEFIRRATK